MIKSLGFVTIGLMSQPDAEAIAGWHYEAPYNFYDWSADERDLAELVDPAQRAEKYFSAHDAGGGLVGFFGFTHADAVVAIGIGLRPDLTGQGLGQSFLETGLAYARERFAPDRFTLSVAAFNSRAICVYERAGFRSLPLVSTRDERRPILLRRDGATSMNDLIQLADEVRAALEEGQAVVALETTIVAHGFPAPHGVEVGLEMERAVREAGAIPATIGALGGRVRVGLDDTELQRFDSDARKLGPRDLAACAVAGDVGASTVGGVLAVARMVGIRFLGTGGIGGVHRGYPTPPDVSADLVALVTAPALVACSGAKSLLDIPATMEHLETLGIPVLGYRTDTLPLFYEATGGPPVTQRVDDPETAARVAAAHWQLGACGLLLTNPPPESLEVGDLIEEAIAEAARQGVSGQAVTPFVLARLHERSGGRTRDVNRKLAVANARLAGEVAVAFASL